MKPQFPDDVLALLREGKGLRIWAGSSGHRVVGIWVVVVKDCAFMRPWSVKPNGWYWVFLKEPKGMIQAGGRASTARSWQFLFFGHPGVGGPEWTKLRFDCVDRVA